MAKYLDASGVNYLWGKIKELFTDQSLNTEKKTYAGAINEINTKVGNLTGAFVWKGKFDALPAVANYSAGNVVGVGNKEYVLTVTGDTKAWVEFGDEGSYLLKSTAESTYLKKDDGVKLTTGSDPVMNNGGIYVSKYIYAYKKYEDGTTSGARINSDGGIDFCKKGQPPIMLIPNSDDQYKLKLQSATGSSIRLSGIDTPTKDDDAATKNYVDTSVKTKLDTSTLTPILQEIDLTGTDAERKAKLDQFEKDWKALTGASDLSGARFVGKSVVPDDGEPLVGVFSFSSSSHWEGMLYASAYTPYKAELTNDGSLTITPLFSHLEAITIYTDNTDAHMKQNLDNIAAYEANLQALGVDTSKSPMLPVKVDDEFNPITGFIQYQSGSADYAGLGFDKSNSSSYEIKLLGTGSVELSKILNSDYKSLNAKSLEAITIKTSNSTADKAANKAAIEGYVNNLKSLGVDVTKGYIITVKNNAGSGYISFRNPTTDGSGFWRDGSNTYTLRYSSTDYGIYSNRIFNDLVAYTDLTTTSKQIVGAINEVNALAKSKGTGTITEIKMNGVSKGTSGVVDLGAVGDVTKSKNNTFTGANTFNNPVYVNDIIYAKSSSRDISASMATSDAPEYYGDNLDSLLAPTGYLNIVAQTDDANAKNVRLQGTLDGFLMSDIDGFPVSLHGISAPSHNYDAANKKYVDDKVAASGGSGSGSSTELHASLAAGETPIDVKLDEDRTTIAVEYESGDTYEGAGMVFTKFVNTNSQGQSSHEEYITDICGKGITVKTKESDGSITDKTAITGDTISTGMVILADNITTDTQAATKKYVDDQIAAKLGTVLTQLQSI